MTRAVIVRKNEQNVIVPGGDRVVVLTGSALLSSFVGGAKIAANTAQSSAAAALAAAGVGEYEDTTDGLAGTIIGETFWVDLGNGTGQVYRHDSGPVATALQRFLIDPTASGAAALLGASGGTIQALLDSALKADTVFSSTFDNGDPSAWGFRLNGEADGKDFDVLQINFVIGSGQRGNGLHVMTEALSGALGGQSIGGAMNGDGIGDALVGNSYEMVTGNGGTFNKVGEGDGYGGSLQFSSTGTGAAGQIIKQNSGVTGTAGIGPALLVTNISDEGVAIDSSTALNNATDTSNRFSRLQLFGINADFRMNAAGARTGAISVVRAVATPAAASTGASVVNLFDAVGGANINGAAEFNGLSSILDGVGNTVEHAIFGLARGANTTNYGGRFGATGGTNNIALRVDGQSWLLGNIQGSLPEYANDAAASATLAIGYWYLNSTTGAVTARRT